MYRYKQIIKHPLCLLLVLVCALASAEKARAKTSSAKIIVDAEISNTLAQIAAPLMPALGEAANRLSLHVMWKNDINAFVTAGAHIVFMSGLIRETENVEELRGVIAHEFGHVLADHYALTVSDTQRAQRNAMLLLLASLPLALVSQEAAIANAVAAPQALFNLTLAERRARETIADNTATNILENAKLSTNGLITFLQKLKDEKAEGYAAYLQSHPATQDRIAFIAKRAREEKTRGNLANAKERENFERMRAKLDAFTFNPRITLKKYAKNKFANNKEKQLSATLARAIAYYRQENLARALGEVKTLIKQKPNDPFFLELKGDILRASEPQKAQDAYRKAIALFEKGYKNKYKKGHELPIRIALFDTILASTDKNVSDSSQKLNYAEKLMKIAIANSPNSILARQRLARLYDRQGKNGQRALVWAEALWLSGERQKAYCSAKEATTQLPKESPARVRANDIAQQALENRKRGEKLAC